MSLEKLQILIIEDSKVSTQIYEDYLSSDDSYIYDFTTVNDWAKAKEKIQTQNFSCILLDNLLPDVKGIDIIPEIKKIAPSLPVILITGKGSEDTAVSAMKNGASDYLVKKKLTNDILITATHNAIDKSLMINELEKIKHDKKHDHEIKILDMLSKTIKTSVTAQMFGYLPIKESIPELFKDFVEEYQSIINLSIEEKAVKVEHNISEKLRILAEKIGFHRGVPKDLIDIHSIALKEKIQDCVAAKAKALIEEGRFLILELMGYLALYYRNYALGSSRFKNEDKQQDGK